VITGGAGADNLSGGAGNDTLIGGAGNDTMAGGAGNDIYVVDAAGDVVTEAASAGTDEVRTTLSSYTLGANVENLRYIGTGNFTGTGNTLANVLTGGAGNDTLDGGTGTDTLIGGAGNDVYIVDVAADVVTENANEGTDEVRTALTTYTLGANIEKLTFTGTAAFTGTGNALDNVITGGNGADTLNGGAGNDALNGGAGNDHMTGGTGNDIYVVDAAGDVVTENAGEGADEVRTALTTYTLGANLENLTGTGSGQTLTGNALANTLSGGANETLAGGGGYDTYRVGAGMGHTTVNNTAADGVTTANGEVDFTAGVANTQLWLERVGNDLQVDILGSSDHLTISGWYGGNARAQVQSIKTADGLTLDSQLAQLASAMAAYSAGNPGFNPTQTSQMPNDPTLQNAVAAAWH
jgi:Ca2+-binding RTX toxin-like protein